MKNNILVFLLVFSLIGCSANNSVVTNNNVIKNKVDDNVEAVKFFIIDDKVLSDVTEYIETSDQIKALITRYDGKAMVESVYNSLQITLTNHDVSNITISQDYYGEFNYEIYLIYETDGVYIADNILSNGNISTYLSVSLEGQYYSFYVENEEYSFDMELDDSIKEKLKKYYEEYLSLNYRKVDYIDDLIDIIKQGNFIKIIDGDNEIISKLNYYDKIMPLKKFEDTLFYNYRYFDGAYVVERNKLYSLLADDEQLLIDYQYGIPEVLNNEFIFFENYLEKVRIDNQEFNVKNYSYYYFGRRNLAYYDGGFVVIDNDAYKYKICKIELSGINEKEVTSFKYIDFTVEENKDGCFYTSTYNVNKFGVVNGNNEIIFELEMDDMYDYYNDAIISEIAVINKSDISVLIDNDGKIIAEDSYYRFVSVYDDKIVVDFFGNYGLINTKGEVIIPFNYQYVTKYKGNFYVLQNNFWKLVEF